MPWTPPATPATNTVITVAWAASSVTAPINWLRAMTGNTDPPLANLALFSTGPSATAWGKLPDDALLVPKVNRTAPIFASFGLAAAALSSFCYINNPGAIADAPLPALLDWLLVQVRHPEPTIDYRWQLTCAMTNQDELYSRNVIAGVAGPWRKVLTSTNFDPLTFDGGTFMRDDIAGGQFQIWANDGRLQILNQDATVSLLDLNQAAAAPAWKGQAVWHDGNTNHAINGDAKLAPSSVTGNAGGSAIGVNVLHANRLQDNTLNAGEINRVIPAGQIAADRLAVGVAVPSGLIAGFRTAAAIAAGWNRCDGSGGRPNLNGRLLVGATVAGTPIGGADWPENAAAGTSWTLQSVTGLPSSGPVQGGGTSTANPGDHTHAVAWTIPTFSVVWAIRT